MAEVTLPTTKDKAKPKKAKVKSSSQADIGPAFLIMMMFGALTEIIDLLDFTLVGTIISVAADVIFLLFFVTWRALSGGFSLKNLFRTKKDVLYFILEHIPFIESIFPGWILILWGLRKKKSFKTK